MYSAREHSLPGDLRPTVLSAFASHATANPAAVAVETPGSQLTYEQLDHDSTEVARALVRGGVKPGDIVPLDVYRTPLTITQIVGVLKAGAAYLPLDPALDLDRRARIIEHAQPVHPFELARPPGSGFQDGTGAELSPPTEDDLAYVMPTSGSMGRLKLVEVTHAAMSASQSMLGITLARLLGRPPEQSPSTSAGQPDLVPGDGYLHCASFGFSSSVRQLFRPLMAGARVVLADEHARKDPLALLGLIRRHRVNVLDLTPSLFQVLVEVLEGEDSSAENLSSHVRAVLLASEALPRSVADRWHLLAEQVPVIGMYGLTETAGIVCVQPVGGQVDEIVPLGKPLDGISATVHPDKQAEDAGDAGDLLISSPGIARGYRNDPELTASTFVAATSGCPDAGTCRTGDRVSLRADGTLRFLGRRDRLVSIAGKQIDLGHIERAAASHAMVSAAIATLTGTAADARLRVHVELRPGVIDASRRSPLRQLPNGLHIIDAYRAETDFMFTEIFEREAYLQHGITLPPRACIIDAGANIGLFSLFATLRSPGARVFAFEPAEPIAAKLRANLRVNASRGVQVRQEALSNRSGTGELTYYPHSPGMSSTYADTADEAQRLQTIIRNQLALGDVDDALEVELLAPEIVSARISAQRLPCTLVRLSDVIRGERLPNVDLLKIDVQKSERDVLDGIEPEHWPLIQQIVMELHDIGGRANKIQELLADHGFVVEAEQDLRFAGSDVHMMYARRPGYRDVVAQTQDDQRAGRRSAPTQAASVSDADLFRFLADRLPDSTIPITIEIVPDLPRTISGKIDPTTLLAGTQAGVGGSDGRAGAAPADELTEAIIEIWQEVLGGAIRPDDDFFQLGGSSLAAARIVARVRERHNPDVSIRSIFDHPQVSEFARLVAGAAPGAAAAAGKPT